MRSGRGGFIPRAPLTSCCVVPNGPWTGMGLGVGVPCSRVPLVHWCRHTHVFSPSLLLCSPLSSRLPLFICWRDFLFPSSFLSPHSAPGNRGGLVPLTSSWRGSLRQRLSPSWSPVLKHDNRVRPWVASPGKPRVNSRCH